MTVDGHPNRFKDTGGHIRGITIKLKNGKKSKEFRGQHSSSNYNRVEKLGSVDVASVAFYVKQRETVRALGTTKRQALVWYGGIKIINRAGETVIEKCWIRDPKMEWVEQKLGEKEYLVGFYGKIHHYHGYVMQLGMIKGLKGLR